jgi:hypothetical protein
MEFVKNADADKIFPALRHLVMILKIINQIEHHAAAALY